MVLYPFNGKEYYIDGILKQRIDATIIPGMQKKDRDFVFVVDGEERSGKSKFADLIGGYISSQLGKPFTTDNFCFSPTEFRQRIINSPGKEVVVYDEAHRGMGSKRAMSEVNNILSDLMMEMGQKNLCVFIVLPSFFTLERYQALHRAKGLFHIYEKRGKRGFWVYFGRKHKQTLYLKGKYLMSYNVMRWPGFRGHFPDQYVVDETDYRRKKALSLKGEPEIEKIKPTASKYKDQRDKFLLLLQKHVKMTRREYEEYLKSNGIIVSDSTINETLKKNRKSSDLTGEVEA